MLLQMPQYHHIISYLLPKLHKLLNQKQHHVVTVMFQVCFLICCFPQIVGQFSPQCAHSRLVNTLFHFSPVVFHPTILSIQKPYKNCKHKPIEQQYNPMRFPPVSTKLEAEAQKTFRTSQITQPK